ncbi:MAG: cyclic nucleotide-binding domain-containing protein [bacterium]|nr:cyclic nucleotide-binding domain-containing protein [bacterium]
MLDIRKYFANLFIDREMRQKIDFFSKISIFKGLNSFDIGKLATAMYCRLYETGEVVCAEQELGKALFIIMSGEVAITRKSGLLKEEKILSRLKSGDFFGEMALLEEKPRSATAKVLVPCQVCIIYKANFDSMIDKNPKIGLAVIKNISVILSSRLRGMIDGG